MPTLGTLMRKAPPTDLAGKMGERFLRILFAFLIEVKSYLEDATIPDAIADLEAMLTNLETILSGVLRTEITDSSGNSAVGANPSGHVAVSVYDERTERALQLLTLAVMDLRQLMASKG